MTDSGQRFAICLALALAAHAGLLAAMTRDGAPEAQVVGRTLAVTISTDSTPVPVQAQVAALAAQAGDDRVSRRAAAALSNPAPRPAPARPAQSSRTPNRVSRFTMTAPAAAAVNAPEARPSAVSAKPVHQGPQRTRSARADPRAAYLAAWKRHIEQRGSRHYPAKLIAAAPENRLTLGVTLMANGQLHSVRILQSSGSTPLDRAAQAIVREASPFAPFPPALRTDNPRLTFAYDWLFVSR